MLREVTSAGGPSQPILSSRQKGTSKMAVCPGQAWTGTCPNWALLLTPPSPSWDSPSHQTARPV
jgi:hypothetical protein